MVFIDQRNVFGQEKKISCYKISTGKITLNTLETKEEDKNTGKFVNLDNMKLTIDGSG